MNGRPGVEDRSDGKAPPTRGAWKRDTLTIGAIAGFASTVAFVLSDWVLVRLVGLDYSAAWEYAAEMYLNPGLVHTPAGRLIGYIGEFMMGTGFGISVAILLRLTGRDNYLLKGLAAAGVWFSILLGGVPRLLHTATWVLGQPFTFFMALKNWILMGIIDSFIIARYAEFAPEEAAAAGQPAAENVEDTSPLEQSLDGLKAAMVEFSGELGELNERLAQIVDAQSSPGRLDGKARRWTIPLVSEGANRADHHRVRIVRLTKRP